MSGDVQINNKTRILEILAVVLTGVGKWVFINILEWRLGFIMVVCLFWVVYAWYRYKKDKWIFAYWGLSGKHFKSTFLELLPFVIICIAAFFSNWK